MYSPLTYADLCSPHLPRAYVSTIGTQLNWGASYVINDFYRRFVKRESTERHYVIASRVVTVLLMIASIIVTFTLRSIGGALEAPARHRCRYGNCAPACAGFGGALTPGQRCSAMIAAAVISLFLQIALKWDTDNPRQFAYLMLVTVGLTTIIWVAVTMATPAEPMEKLVSFYRRVKPEGPGWSTVAAVAGLAGRHAEGRLATQFLNWFLGCALIYGALFGIGKIIFKEWLSGLLYLVVAIAAGESLISWNLSRVGWAEERLISNPPKKQYDVPLCQQILE